MRLAGLLALATSAVTLGLASPAHAADPTVTTVTKCGYLEVTIVWDTNTTASVSFYADAGSEENIPVRAGTNVYRLYSRDGSSGLLEIEDPAPGEGTWKFSMDYREPAGCKLPQLAFRYEPVCGGKVLVTVTNTGEVPAEDMAFYRRHSTVHSMPRELAVGGLTFPIGTTHVLVDKLDGDLSALDVERNVQAGRYWAGRPPMVRYVQPGGCTGAPTVSLAASCTGVDITTTPNDAPITTEVLGQADTAPRAGTGRHLDMAAGEGLLVKSGGTVASAFAYQRPADCSPASASAGPILAVTGGRTMLPLVAGSALLLLGIVTLALARRRRHVNG